MNARLARWAMRVWGALSMTYMAGVALFMIAATLFSNMDRFWAAAICVTIVLAGVVCLRWLQQTYFGSVSPAGTAMADEETEDTFETFEAAVAEMPEIVVNAPMADGAATISREALAHLTGASEKEMWL